MALGRLAPLIAALMFTFDISSAVAQSSRTRFEVGGGATVLRLSRYDTTTAGISGRSALDVTKSLSPEAEVTFFPDDDIVIRAEQPSIDLALGHHRRRTDGFLA